MKLIQLLLFFSPLAQDIAAQQATPERTDTTLSPFWYPNLKVRVQILEPEQENSERNNTLLTLYAEEAGGQCVLFRDSIYAFTLRFRYMDIDGDGLRDLLVYHTSNGAENPCYNAYLLDQKRGRMRPVKGFRKVFTPQYDREQCILYGFEVFERRLNMRRYHIDKNGTLFRVGG